MSLRRAFTWGLPALLYLTFMGWYTDFGGPLRKTEIDHYAATLTEQGRPPASVARIRQFMENDSGRQFFMLNAIDYAENPPDVPGAAPGESATQLMDRYMEHMFRELFKRGCHPAMMGNAIHTAIDLVGVDGLRNADTWDMGAFFRYRSRRTFMEIITIPATKDRHAFKVAALEKTFAYPVETEINLADPRVLLGFMLLSAAGLFDLALVRPKL